jgi:hypothetical protein
VGLSARLSVRLSVSAVSSQAIVSLVQPGEVVIVAWEPCNPHDPDAQAVYTPDMQLLGYIPREDTGQFPLEVRGG